MGKFGKYYATLTLTELRYRQNLNSIQTAEAYRMAQGAESRSRGLRAMTRLQRIRQLLNAAVLKHI